MDHTTESKHYDIIIDDPALTAHGFTKFSLPLNGNAAIMIVHNIDNSKMMYPTFYKSDLGKTVESLRDRIISDEVLIDNDTADGLVAYFRNAGILLSEDGDSPFFKNGHGNGNAFSTNQGQEEERKSAAQKVLDLIDQHCHEIFTDQFGTPYAAVKIREHIETLPLKDSRFRNWLCRIYYISEGNVLNSETVSNVLNILKAKAEFEGNARTLSLRVASVQEQPFTIYYDLANKEWQVVKITPIGWSIENSPIIFRRHKSQQPQVYPSKEYSPDVFDRFMDLMNIKGKDETLLEKGYIVSLFYPDIPKPISVVMAEHGSAKTTEHELQKKLVDPSGTETLTFPRKINELVQKLSHNYVAYFDNVSKLPDWVSDQLCRAATGSGFSKRELYTDDEDIIYNFIRCTGINGINIAGLKQDLLDRAILRKRERIPKDKRRTKIDVHAEFDRLRPQLLGYIFDVLVNVLKVKSQGGIKLKELLRMADFAEIAEIACRCMGYKDNNEFLRAYDKNIELQVEEALAANLISNAIIKLMESKAEWMGTASQLLTDLEQAATEIKINLNSKGWPKGANVLSGRLDEVKTNLREIGIVIDKEAAKDPKTRVKTILIQNVKLCKQSLESFEQPEDKNRAQIATDNSNDQNKAKRYDRSQAEGSFAENEQNCVQNSGSNDANDANDTLHTFCLCDLSSDILEEWYQNERKKIKPLDPSLFAFSGYRCYYCEDFETDNSKDSKRNYEIHVKNKHGDDVDHPCYPSKADLERLGLKPQWKRWEIQENVDLQMSNNNKSKTREKTSGHLIELARARTHPNIPLTCHHTLESFGFHTSNKIGGDAVSDTYNRQVPLCHPFVKWAGGKAQLLPQLYALVPPKFDRYFEPFLGGGALFFYLISNKNKPFTAYISDINPELINVYVAVKDDVEKLIKLLTQHQIEYNKAPEECYYKLRHNYNLKSCSDGIERAAQFITLNRTCFNGLYRVNKKGEFNAPKGDHKNPTICDAGNLRNVSAALRYSNITIKSADYKDMLRENAREGDFIYLDPPYNPVSSTAHFTNYTDNGFSYNDQKRLAEIYKQLDEMKCNVMLTNSNTPLVRELYAPYVITEVDSKRAINCKGAKREGHSDLIICNYKL